MVGVKVTRTHQHLEVYPALVYMSLHMSILIKRHSYKIVLIFHQKSHDVCVIVLTINASDIPHSL